MNKEKILDISWGTFFKLGITILLFYIIYLIKDLILWFIFALIISLLFAPGVEFLEKIKIPRFLATFIVFGLIFSLLGCFLYFFTFQLVKEISQFAKFFPEYFEKLSPPLKQLGFEFFEDFQSFTKEFQKWFLKASQGILSAITTLFGGILATIAILSLSFFLVLEREGIEKAILLLAPKDQEKEVLNIWKISQKKVAGWFASRILACIFVALFSFLSLVVLKIRYPFLLALFAGLTNIVPVVGPIIAGTIMAILALLDSPLKSLLILIAFFLVQQIENQIFTPFLAKKFMDLSPALVLMALLIGGKLSGILGAILAIPLTGILIEFATDYLKKRKNQNLNG